jgi:HEAT repeat protein
MGEPDVEPVVFAEPQEPGVQSWRDYRDNEVKGYFCRQENGEFVAYLNWAGAADLQSGLFGLGTDDEYGDHIEVPYEGFDIPPYNETCEQILFNRVTLLTNSQRAQCDDESQCRHRDRLLDRFFEIFVSRAEAYQAFVAVHGLRQTKTVRLFDLIQLHYVEDAITPEDLQERIADWPADQDIVTFLIEATGSPYFRTRQLGAELLRKYPSPRSIPPLIALLADTEDDVRSEAAETLGFQRATEAVPTLCRAADSSDSYLRANVAEALGAISMRSPDVAAVLLRLLEDENEVVRCFAAEALGDLKEVSALEALTLHVDDVPIVRVWACYARVRLGEPLRWNVILEGLADRSDDNGRLQAAMVLYWLANEEGLKPRILSTLRKALQNETKPELIERLEHYVRDLSKPD